MPNLTEATETICQCFHTNWADRTQVEWPNVIPENGQKLSQGNEAYVALHIKHEGSDQSSFGGEGGRVFVRQGQVIAQVFVPVGKRGLEEATQLAKVASDAFEGKTLGGVRFYRVSARTVGPDGPWYQMNVSADFEFDEIK
jgi:hypothetical protein